MWMSICQGIILVAVLARFLADLTRAIKGAPAKEATGLPGAVAVCIALGLALLVCWRAGSFSTMVGP